MISRCSNILTFFILNAWKIFISIECFILLRSREKKRLKEQQSIQDLMAEGIRDNCYGLSKSPKYYDDEICSILN